MAFFMSVDVFLVLYSSVIYYNCYY